MADHREPPYDPYIPNGGNAQAGPGGNQRTAALQAVGEIIHTVIE